MDHLSLSLFYLDFFRISHKYTDHIILEQHHHHPFGNSVRLNIHKYVYHKDIMWHRVICCRKSIKEYKRWYPDCLVSQFYKSSFLCFLLISTLSPSLIPFPYEIYIYNNLIWSYFSSYRMDWRIILLHFRHSVILCMYVYLIYHLSVSITCSFFFR